MKHVCKKPGPVTRRIIARDHKVVSHCVTREYPFVFKKGRGCFVWDADGKKYLDFAAGISVINIGHAHPAVLKAIRKQLSFGTHAAFADFYAEPPVSFIEELLSVIPHSLNTAFLSNSGTEAVEAAYKMARWHSNKKWVIAFKNSFHGRTMGSLSMTNSKPVQRERFHPFLPVHHIPFPYYYRMNMEPERCSEYCLEQAEDALRQLQGKVAALFVEPIQGEGGYIVPPLLFLKGLKKLCTEYKVLLCADEIQSGCFRTGTFLASEGFGVTPDIVSLAKAVGGGLPLGATVARKELSDWPPGAHANTFGGNLLACAAATATLAWMKQKRIWNNVRTVGELMMDRLQDMQERHELIGDVRGRGLMIGIELVKDRESKKPALEERHTILCKAKEKGLVLLPAGESAIRLCPPLIITKRQAEQGLDILESAIRGVRT